MEEWAYGEGRLVHNFGNQNQQERNMTSASAHGCAMDGRNTRLQTEN